MHNASELVFKTLADPNRRAIFERLARIPVPVLTDPAGVSQPAVSGVSRS
jgi:DNA-binding transcriptional ArsR family regulator